MSSDNSQWSAVTPDFVYIFKIGDFQHVLRPADFRSSENLKLVQLAVGNVDMARSLLTERGPFLLSEKQQKMDESIFDAEEAINRVIKLLQPARVEQISEESIRINTKNAWTLDSSDPKSAATFGRLELTHNKLKTVLHDLKNIEATAQLDTCEVRANAIVSSPDSEQDRDQDATQSLALKYGQGMSKQTQNSEISSASRISYDGQSDMRSPVSSQGNTMIRQNDLTTRISPDQKSNTSGFHMEHDKGDPSGLHAERLPVIHEMDASSTEAIIYSPPPENTKTLTHANVDSSLSEPNKKDGKDVQVLRYSKPATPPRAVSNRTLVQPTINSDAPALIDTSSPIKPIKRETFADYRRRNRDSRFEPGDDARVSMESPSDDDHLQQVMQNRREIGDLRPENLVPVLNPGTSGRVQFNGRVIEPFPPTSNDAPQQNSNRPDMALTPRTFEQQEAKAIIQERRMGEAPISLQSMSDNIVLPARPQPSPPTQTPSSATRAHASDELFLKYASSKPAHEIVSIDAELTRLPSLLRAGPKGNTVSPYVPPHVASDIAGPDTSFESSGLGQPGTSIDRSVTAPPMPYPNTRNTSPTIRSMSVVQENSRSRSQSDSIVPQINVTRVPTIPRKPLPYRNKLAMQTYKLDESSVPVAAPSTNLETHQYQQQNLKPIKDNTSGPPSPLDPEDATSSIPDRQDSGSIHSMSVQGRSTGSSRSSSVSIGQRREPQSFLGARVPQDDPFRAQVQSKLYQEHAAQLPGPHSSPARPPIPNPLTMNPPDARASAYQAQKLANGTKEAQESASNIIHQKSPTYQQVSQLQKPDTRGQVEPPLQQVVQYSSRFRDDDQRRPPIQPVRTFTEPAFSKGDDFVSATSEKSRRASEQYQTSKYIPNDATNMYQNRLSQRSPAQRPPGMEPIFSQTFTPPSQRQQLQPTNSLIRPQEITRTVRPGNGTIPTQRPPAPEMVNYGSGIQQNVAPTKVKDRELFGRKVWNHAGNAQPSPPTAQHIQPQPQPPPQQQQHQQHRSQWPAQQAAQTQPPVQQQPQYMAQPQRSSSYPPTKVHAHDCQCEDEVTVPRAQVYPQAEPQQLAPPSRYYSGVHQSGLAPLHESHEQQSTPSAKTVMSSEQKPQNGLPNNPNAQPQMSVTEASVKKRSSWLGKANRLLKEKR